MSFTRRKFLALAGLGATGVALGTSLDAVFASTASGQSLGRGTVGLTPDAAGILDLPPEFRYRIMSRTGDTMSDGNLVPADHDGMAAFSMGRGRNRQTILVRNHELSPNETPAAVGQRYDPACAGGTTTLIVGPDRTLIRDYVSLAGTYRNCGGGPTPWGSWISSEENTSVPGAGEIVLKRHGYNFEVPAQAQGSVNPVPLIAMGRFYHEAIAVDPITGYVYQTEDRGDGCFYRFIPNVKGKLDQGGTLEALKIVGQPQAITKTEFPVQRPMAVEWVKIDDVDPAEDNADQQLGIRYEAFSKGAAQFTRGEGIAVAQRGDRVEIFFACTNGGRIGKGQIWRYEPGKRPQDGMLTLWVEPNDANLMDAPDNITVAPWGHLVFCEDGAGEQFVRGITTQGKIYNIARNAMNENEFAGATFANNTLFVNIQNPGYTFAIWGPFEKLASG